MPPDPYVYEGTSCLRNHLGIRDPEELARVEAEQSAIRIAQVARDPLAGQYDLDHLKAFHRLLLGDIYAWAGELLHSRDRKGRQLVRAAPAPRHVP